MEPSEKTGAAAASSSSKVPVPFIKKNRKGIFADDNMLSLYKFSHQALGRVSKPGHIKVQEACDIWRMSLLALREALGKEH